MLETIDLSIERLRRLPQHPTDVWQGALARLPQWVTGEGEPFRPLLPIWRSVQSDRVGGAKPLRPAEALVEATVEQSMLEALLHLSRQADVGYRPARVAVRDARLEAILGAALAGTGIAVDLVEELPLIDDLLAEMTRDLTRSETHLDPLDAPGVDVERMRAFAEAAADFYRAAPWNHLSNEDLLRIESKAPHRELAWFTVLGAGGVEYGLGFYAARKHHELIHSGVEPEEYFAKRGGWSLTFDHPSGVPLADADLWEAEGFPAAGARAYPFLVHFHPQKGFERADAAVLAFVEGVLRALVASTEDDFDSGRWSKTVATSDGAATVELSIPTVLEHASSEAGDESSLGQPSRKKRGKAGALSLPDRRVMEGIMKNMQRAVASRGLESVDEINRFLGGLRGKPVPPVPATTPAERAQELFYEALEHEGRVRIKLARQALGEWPDCADALVLLAEEMPDADRQMDLFRQAMEAGERAIGPDVFREQEGHFWGILETRPFLRAKLGYARCLEDDGQVAEAVAHMLEIVRLNPSDNQGVRFTLIPRLLELGRDEEASRQLAEYEDDCSPAVTYSRALSEFRRAGDSAEARRLLIRATGSNRFLPKLLLASEAPPPVLGDSYRPGSEEEAALMVPDLTGSWRETPGALEWLRGARREQKKERRAKKKRGRKG